MLVLIHWPKIHFHIRLFFYKISTDHNLAKIIHYIHSPKPPGTRQANQSRELFSSLLHSQAIILELFLTWVKLRRLGAPGTSPEIQRGPTTSRNFPVKFVTFVPLTLELFFQAWGWGAPSCSLLLLPARAGCCQRSQSIPQPVRSSEGEPWAQAGLCSTPTLLAGGTGMGWSRAGCSPTSSTCVPDPGGIRRSSSRSGHVTLVLSTSVLVAKTPSTPKMGEMGMLQGKIANKPKVSGRIKALRTLSPILW